MKFSPDLERDIREVEEKLRKRRNRKRLLRRAISGGVTLWSAIVLGVITGTVPAGFLQTMLIIVCITLGMVAMVLLGWTMYAVMEADLNHEL